MTGGVFRPRGCMKAVFTMLVVLGTWLQLPADVMAQSIEAGTKSGKLAGAIFDAETGEPSIAD